MVDYLHRDEVVRLMRLVATEVVEALGDLLRDKATEFEIEEIRIELARRVRIKVEPLLQEGSTPESG